MKSMVDQADTFAQASNREEAAKLFEKAKNLALETETAVFSGYVCRYGELDGFAEIVESACSQAVEMASNKQKDLFKDSRGIVLAQKGEFEAAIKDFESFQEWAKENGWSEQYRISRDKWIDKLRAQENPFFNEITFALWDNSPQGSIGPGQDQWLTFVSKEWEHEAALRAFVTNVENVEFLIYHGNSLSWPPSDALPPNMGVLSDDGQNRDGNDQTREFNWASGIDSNARYYIRLVNRGNNTISYCLLTRPDRSSCP